MLIGTLAGLLQYTSKTIVSCILLTKLDFVFEYKTEQDFLYRCFKTFRSGKLRTIIDKMVKHIMKLKTPLNYPVAC